MGQFPVSASGGLHGLCHSEEHRDEESLRLARVEERFFASAEFILSPAEGRRLRRNKMPHPYHPWIPAFAGMTKTTRSSFRASSARPGIQEPPVSASTLSAPRYKRLSNDSTVALSAKLTHYQVNRRGELDSRLFHDRACSAIKARACRASNSLSTVQQFLKTW